MGKEQGKIKGCVLTITRVEGDKWKGFSGIEGKTLRQSTEINTVVHSGICFNLWALLTNLNDMATNMKVACLLLGNAAMCTNANILTDSLLTHSTNMSNFPLYNVTVSMKR